MKPTTAMTTKKLRGTVPGELVKVFVGSTSVFGIVIATDPRVQVIGLLQPVGHIPYASHADLNPEKGCIAFGQDWVIRPVLSDESWFGNSQFFDSPGCLFLSGEEYFTVFKQSPDDYNHTEITFNLSASKMDTFQSSSAVPISSWEIWEKESDLSVPGAAPLLTVSAWSTT
ncbi:hypothetical protein HB779_02095 [Phyllobacterium sp. 628]|uniref:hypothetical protein n=1 Tax=Phyllobacterium sp. 628 TaxID=2718938 RepID=UPI00166236B3|nr:hypothetical protein [Phyllobacterium sp. 628]QND50812.1 hypothetical protein HB779_02095 [Phyllobacterium sp. 628]